MNEKIKIIAPNSSKELFEELQKLEEDKNVRVVILKFPNEKTFGLFDDYDKSVVSQIHCFLTPLITIFKEQAIGTLFEILLASHICVSSDTTKFEISRKDLLEINVSEKNLEKLDLVENEFDAQTALDLGIINRINKAEDLENEALEMAETISKLAPLAIKADLSAVNSGVEMDLEKGLEMEIELFSQIFSTADMREGTKAFLEKRQPYFTGK